MHILILLFMCLSCFAAEDDNPWDFVESGEFCVNRPIIPFGKDTAIGVWRFVGDAKDGAVSKAYSICRNWWWNADRCSKAGDVFLWGALAVAGAFILVPPGQVCLAAWGITTLAGMGVIGIREDFAGKIIKLSRRCSNGMIWRSTYLASGASDTICV